MLVLSLPGFAASVYVWAEAPAPVPAERRGPA
jgi:hypothetical protein